MAFLGWYLDFPKENCLLQTHLHPQLIGMGIWPGLANQKRAPSLWLQWLAQIWHLTTRQHQWDACLIARLTASLASSLGLQRVEDGSPGLKAALLSLERDQPAWHGSRHKERRAGERPSLTLQVRSYPWEKTFLLKAFWTVILTLESWIPPRQLMSPLNSGSSDCLLKPLG